MTGEDQPQGAPKRPMEPTKLGPYKIVEPLGKGSMGEVYRAEDTRQGRRGAIKVMPEEFATDRQRLFLGLT